MARLPPRGATSSLPPQPPEFLLFAEEPAVVLNHRRSRSRNSKINGSPALMPGAACKAGSLERHHSHCHRHGLIRKCPRDVPSLGCSIAHQGNQAVGQRAAPAEIVVSALELLEMHFVALDTQHVA